VVERYRRLILPDVHPGSNDAAEVRGSSQETSPRKTTTNTVKHRDGGVGLVVANHRSGGESLVVVTTLVVESNVHHAGQIQVKTNKPHVII